MAKMDVITEELIGNWLRAITDEMGIVLIQTSYSTTIKERRDCSTQLFTREGRIMCQGEHIPVHLGSSKNAANVILGAFPHIDEGDVFVVNDPYAGAASHLNDICMLAPFFYEGTLLGFASCVAHHTDLGGVVPGGASYASDSIHQEGLFIPPLRLVKQGELVQDVADLIARNTRDRRVRQGDINAQLGACAIGVRRLAELCRRYGAKTFEAAVDGLMADSAEKMRRGIGRIPNGEYTFTDYLDCSGIRDHTSPLPIVVRLRIDDQTARLDFAGTSPQVDSAVNLVFSGLVSAVWYAFRVVTGINAHPNEGCYDPISIEAPAGSLVNCSYPSPVAQRTDTCQRVVDAVMGALAQAVPDRVMAGCHSTITSLIFGGTNPRDGSFYIYNDVVAGGMGGRVGVDGIDGVQVHITNSSNLPIESLENEFPLLVTIYELITDSCGPGKFRGGMGIRRGIQPVRSEPIVTAATERHDTSPWGLLGGKAGARGCVTIGTESGGRFYQRRLHEETVLVETPGGGGYGDPLDRDPVLVRRDVVDGRISERAAREQYGVVITPTHGVDSDKTSTLRRKMRQ